MVEAKSGYTNVIIRAEKEWLGMEAIIRYHFGYVVAACGSKGIFLPGSWENLTLRHGLRFSKAHGIRIVVAECDVQWIEKTDDRMRLKNLQRFPDDQSAYTEQTTL
ncbi:hypothetical protein Fot_29453 [Forsythia ovata]|uniref:Uncharacterized protein n=1 Tax=Forsythia ovata TaxID=205694 RepID=A0ABD1TRW8_9LAMI